MDLAIDRKVRTRDPCNCTSRCVFRRQYDSYNVEPILRRAKLKYPEETKHYGDLIKREKSERLNILKGSFGHYRAVFI